MADKQQKHDATQAASKAKQPKTVQSVETGPEQIAQEAKASASVQRALAAPPLEISPADILTLQRTIGNQAVNRLFAQKAKPPTALLHPIQAKLTVGPANDQYEQEADRVAQQVVSEINTPQSQGSDSDGGIQRQPLAEEEAELQRKPLVQRQPAEGGMDVSADIDASIQAARGSGRPLAENVRASMENAFNADFSGVNVHTDAGSDTLNRSVQARAFTTGQDIFFREGEYKPNSKEGQQLLAHELTHVVQQNGGQLQRNTWDENGAREPKQHVKQLETRNSSRIQRKWYVWEQIAIWVQENSSEVKTPCPPGYTEVEGTPELYGDGWQPYAESEPGENLQENKTENQESSPMTQTIQLGIRKIGQQEMGWCYAATSKIVDDYVAKTNVPLWKYVQSYQATHGQPTANDMDEKTIRSTFGNSYGVETFLHSQKGDDSSLLSEEIIYQSLYLMNSPIILGLGSHSYIMYGYDPQAKQLFLWDPLNNEDVDYYTIASLNDMYLGSLDVIYGFQAK